MWTSRTFDSELTLLSCTHACWILTAACAFKHHQMPPKASDSMEFLIAMLLKSIKTFKSYEGMTYMYLPELRIITDAKDRVVIIIECSLSLKSKLMKSRENTKGKDSLRAVERCRKPSCPEELYLPVDKAVLPTITEGYCNQMNAGDIHHAEVRRSVDGTCTCGTCMS